MYTCGVGYNRYHLSRAFHFFFLGNISKNCAIMCWSNDGVFPAFLVLSMDKSAKLFTRIVYIIIIYLHLFHSNLQIDPCYSHELQEASPHTVEPSAWKMFLFVCQCHSLHFVFLSLIIYSLLRVCEENQKSMYRQKIIL